MSKLSDQQKEAITLWMDDEGFSPDKLQAGDYTKDARDFLVQTSLGKPRTIDTRAVKSHLTSYLNIKTKRMLTEFMAMKKPETEAGVTKGTTEVTPGISPDSKGIAKDKPKKAGPAVTPEPTRPRG